MKIGAVPFPLLLLLALAACSPSAAHREEARAASEAAEEVPGGPTVDAPLPDAETRAEALAALRRGIHLRSEGDAAAAEASFARAIERSPHFAEWAHVIAARAAGAARDTTAVRRHLEPLGAGAAREWGWRVRTAALREAGDDRAALRFTERMVEELSVPAARAQAWAAVGTLRRESGDTRGALTAFRQAMQLDAGGSGGLEAARAAHDLPGLGPDDRLAIGRTLLAHGGATRGVPQLEAYLAAGGASEEERRRVRLEAGRALYRARDWEGAHRHLSAVAGSSASAALLAARADYRRGRRAEGRAALLDVPRRFPGSDEGAEALFIVADLEHDSGRMESARELYRQAVATGAHAAAAADAVVRLAGMAILRGDHRTATAELGRYLAARPRDARSAPAVYWLGRAHLLAEDRDAAREHFLETVRLDPFSYYGGLAAERLGTSIRQFPLPPAPEVPAGAAGDVEATVFRMDLLRELDLADAAAFEMSLLRSRMAGSPEALYAVAEAMIERGQPVAGALLGREIHRERGAWDERLLRIVFQYPYREAIERESRRNGLDPFEVAGLIRQESLFNPIAESPVGAMGLMQLMPATARGLASGAGIPSFRPEMLRDPEINVRLGTRFLASQMRRWGGNRNDAFAAYNAGPNRVARWRTFPERADEDVYVERIPIEETRDYVKKVRFHAHVYRRLYGE